MGSVKLLNFCIKKKKNFTRCQDVKTICYMFFFSKKSVHYESSTMYQVNRCQEWESKPSLSTKKKKFVNVKPVRFLHSTRSEMKNQGLCRISDHKKLLPFLILTRKSPVAGPAPPLSWNSCFGKRAGQGFWFYKYCRSLDILYIYIHKYIYIKFLKIILNYCSFQIANNVTFIIAWKKKKCLNSFEILWYLWLMNSEWVFRRFRSHLVF